MTCGIGIGSVASDNRRVFPHGACAHALALSAMIRRNDGKHRVADNRFDACGDHATTNTSAGASIAHAAARLDTGS